jgi:hypothetical protein
MSRSYGKKYAWDAGEYHGDYPPAPHGWKSIRFAELQAIKDEMCSPEYGDVIFPLDVPTASRMWSHMNGRHCSKQRIRVHIMTEIRNILNGYSGKQKGYEADFLEDFYRIKSADDPDGTPLRFEWLKFDDAKWIIRTWRGEPVDVLYYLNWHRVIEKAVRLDYYKTVRK